MLENRCEKNISEKFATLIARLTWEFLFKAKIVVNMGIFSVIAGNIVCVSLSECVADVHKIVNE